MIIGTGIDIIDTRRIDKVLRNFGKKFINRCFVYNEIQTSNFVKNKINFFAKRYAAKEACAKALGTGLARGVFWKDIEVYNNKYGKPQIKLHNNALKFFKNLSKNKDLSIELSLTDEKKYAIANVIIYEN